VDIDIDVATSFKLEAIFPTAVKASMAKADELVPHPCGAYFQNVPLDALTNLAAIPYERAQELGALKIDFLNLTAINIFDSREEMLELLEVEPDWTLLQIPSVVKQLFQVGAHYDLLAKLKPRNILELADCLALLRPQKRYLVEKYMQDPVRWRRELYSKGGGEGYGFKKAHAIAYAMVIVLQLHLIKAGVK
jgi:hypothetical protein